MSTKTANPRQVKVERALVAASVGLLVLLFGLSAVLKPQTASGAELSSAQTLDAQMHAWAQQRAASVSADDVAKRILLNADGGAATPQSKLEGAFDEVRM